MKSAGEPIAVDRAGVFQSLAVTVHFPLAGEKTEAGLFSTGFAPWNLRHRRERKRTDHDRNRENAFHCEPPLTRTVGTELRLYSARSAAVGLIAAARRAGKYAAVNATIQSKAISPGKYQRLLETPAFNTDSMTLPTP